MQYETLNTRKEKPSPLPIYFEELNNPVSLVQHTPAVFRLVYIPEGNGVIEINAKAVPFFGPCVLCINEIESCSELELKQGTMVFYFNPTYLNSSLIYSNIRKDNTDADPAVIENRLLIWPFIKRTETYSGLINIGAESNKRVYSLLKAIQREMSAQDSGWWPCRTRGFLTDLLFFLSQYVTNNQQHSGLSYTNISDSSKELLNFICGNYQKKITVDALAQQFGTNRTSLNTRIKELTGLPINQYIIELRLRNASLLLTDSELPIAEIAEKVGIEDISNFERLFKKRYTVTPGEYRKQNKASKT